MECKLVPITLQSGKKANCKASTASTRRIPTRERYIHESTGLEISDLTNLIFKYSENPRYIISKLQVQELRPSMTPFLTEIGVYDVPPLLLAPFLLELNLTWGQYNHLQLIQLAKMLVNGCYNMILRYPDSGALYRLTVWKYVNNRLVYPILVPAVLVPVQVFQACNVWGPYMHTPTPIVSDSQPINSATEVEFKSNFFCKISYSARIETMNGSITLFNCRKRVSLPILIHLLLKEPFIRYLLGVA